MIYLEVPLRKDISIEIDDNILFVNNAWSALEKTIQFFAKKTILDICNYIEDIDGHENGIYEITLDRVKKIEKKHKKKEKSKIKQVFFTVLEALLDILLFFIPFAFNTIFQEKPRNITNNELWAYVIAAIVLTALIVIRHHHHSEE